MKTIIPRNPEGLDFLQPAQCAYADDLAVAASSFRDLMTALAPAFHSVDHTAGLNRDHRKRCLVQYGSDTGYRRTVRSFVRFTVGRPSGKFIQRVLSSNASTQSLVCPSAPDKATLKAEAHALQCTTAGPYNAIPTCVLGVGSVCGLGPDFVGVDRNTLHTFFKHLAHVFTPNCGSRCLKCAFVPSTCHP